MTDDDIKTALEHDAARRTVEHPRVGGPCSVPGCALVATTLIGLPGGSQANLCLRHATERRDAVYWCKVQGCTRAAKHVDQDGIPLCDGCKESRDKAKVYWCKAPGCTRAAVETWGPLPGIRLCQGHADQARKERMPPVPCTSCHKVPCDGSRLGCETPKPPPAKAEEAPVEPPAKDECPQCRATFGHVPGCGSAPPPLPGAKEPLEDYRLIARRLALLAFRRAEQTLDQLIVPPESVKLAGDLLNLADRALCLMDRKGT